MAALDQIIDGVKEVLKMSAEIKRLSEAVRDINVDVRDLDRRVVRLETMAEMSQGARGPRLLPPNS